MLLYVHRDRADYKGRPGAQDGHLDFHTAPEFVRSVLLYVHRDRYKDYKGRPGAQNGHFDFHTAPEL